MIPIAIVTRNRHALLDVTLRSLSATQLPRGTPLVIYDDASDHGPTRTYLYSASTVSVAARFPRGVEVRSRSRAAGLEGRVAVVRLGERPGGVVSAGCRALRHLLDNADTSGGLVLLQDDVVLRPDWMKRLMRARARTPDAGVIAGLHLNALNQERRPPVTFIATGGVTAQCYWFTSAGLGALEPHVRRRQRAMTGFDTRICRWIREAGLGVYLAHPPVGQHFGSTSLVRPHWRWNWRGPEGRVDLDAVGPYALADEVRPFPAVY
jgi:hypothetical protein